MSPVYDLGGLRATINLSFENRPGVGLEARWHMIKRRKGMFWGGQLERGSEQKIHDEWVLVEKCPSDGAKVQQKIYEGGRTASEN